MLKKRKKSRLWSLWPQWYDDKLLLTTKLFPVLSIHTLCISTNKTKFRILESEFEDVEIPFKFIEKQQQLFSLIEIEPRNESGQKFLENSRKHWIKKYIDKKIDQKK